MRFVRLCIYLLAASSWLHAANILVSCGAVNGTGIDNNNGTWTMDVICADNVAFHGTAFKVDTGAPSDYRIRGVFSDGAGGTFGDTIHFDPMPGFTLPMGPQVAYWHELHGVMNLGGNQGALAEIQFVLDGTDLQGAGRNCVGDDPALDTGMINGSFSKVGMSAFCNDTPLWTRGAVNIRVDFNANVAANGSITLGQGSADSNFQGAPEPATCVTMLLGLVALEGLRRYYR